jgi:hypothetical protein
MIFLRMRKYKIMPRPELISSFALLIPAGLAAMHARSSGMAAAHATAICASAFLSVAYWSTLDGGALPADRVSAVIRAAVDVAALSVALACNLGKAALPVGIGLLAMAFAAARNHGDDRNRGDERLRSLLHSTFHIIVVLFELALIDAAYA